MVKAQETSKRVNFILSEGIYKGLEKLAKKKQTSVAEILRDAIALEIWLQKELEQGNTLLVGKGSKFKEVVFPR